MSEKSSPEWMEQVEKIVKGVAEKNGCLLYDLEFSGAGKGRVLRIFIDREDGNVSIDDCSNVSKDFNAEIESNEDIVPGAAYTLEVSTPGLERHLKEPWHFQKAVGKKILVKTHKSLESMGVTDKRWKAAKTVEEVLTGANEQGLQFVVKDVEINIPYAQVERAKVVFEMTKGQKK